MRQKLLIVVFIFFSIASVQLVWAETLAEFSAPYAAGLEGMADAKSWSPKQGTREGTVDNVAAGQRTTTIYAKNVQWSQTATNWINYVDYLNPDNSNYGRTSITFHSFGPANSCSTFRTRSDVDKYTTLPGTRSVQTYKRQCWSYATEARFVADGKVLPNINYEVRLAYKEGGTAPTGTQTFTFDTYFQKVLGYENYHGNFCVTATGNTAQSCP